MQKAPGQFPPPKPETIVKQYKNSGTLFLVLFVVIPFYFVFFFSGQTYLIFHHSNDVQVTGDCEYPKNISITELQHHIEYKLCRLNKLNFMRFSTLSMQSSSADSIPEMTVFFLFWPSSMWSCFLVGKSGCPRSATQ